MGGGWAAGWEAAGWAAACLPAACRARPIALGHRVEHGHRAVQVPRARAVVAEEQLPRPAAHGARVSVTVGAEPALDAGLGRRVEAPGKSYG